MYLDSCVMTRTARIHLEKGPQTVVLTGLGKSVDQDSLRLNVPAGVEGSNVQMEYLTKEQKEERCAELKKRIKTLERQLTSLAEQAELWKTTPTSPRETTPLPERSLRIWNSSPKDWRRSLPVRMS